MRYWLQWACVPLFVLFALACDSREPARTSEAPRQLGEAPQRLNAQTLYRNAGCATCHRMPGDPGEPLAGPPLRNLSEHWNREDLADFIGNPEAFVASDPRIAAQKARYPMAMPGAPSLSQEARLAIADWMLEF
jgi:mono/diheme cytochrome c family protein